MQIYEGKTAFRGIAEGKIKVYRKDQQQIKREHAEDTQEELLRFDRAKGEALRQLTGLYEKALKEVGEANAAIFEVHQMMLEDPDYVESITNMIRTQKVDVYKRQASDPAFRPCRGNGRGGQNQPFRMPGCYTEEAGYLYQFSGIYKQWEVDDRYSERAAG